MQAEPDTPLLWVIREQVGLTGTKYGCGVAACGACTVHINGEVQRSCSLPLSAVKASDKIVTIEGLSANSSHPVQKAWLDGRRAAMRLLPVRPDHGRRGAAEEEAEADRCRHRRGDDQHLPLRHLPAHPRGRASRCRATAPATRAPPIARSAGRKGGNHEKDDLWQRPEALPPLVRRRRDRRHSRHARARLQGSVRHRSRRAERRGRSEHLGRDQAGRHVRHSHCALRDGPGHAHRPRPARRRRARVRLEEGHHRRHLARPQSRQQARVGRHEHRRLARHPGFAGLCAQGRRCRAHDAAAGSGRSVEGAGR